MIAPGSRPADHRDEVLHRLRALAEVAERAGVQLLHENEKDIYGDVPERCLDVVTSVGSPHLRLAWDPANFVQVGVRHPHAEGFDLLRPFLAAVHIKDSVAETGAVVLPGAGDGDLRQTLAALKADDFDGVFTLEPHLATAGTFSGTSGPVLFRQASAAFKALLAEQGTPWI